MFAQIAQGLRRALFSEDEILYFSLHMEQDEGHGAWLEEALVRYASTPDAQSQIQRGAMLSLKARRRLWDGSRLVDRARLRRVLFALPCQ